MAKKKISPEQVMQELAAIAFARVPDYMEFQEEDVRLREGLKPLERAAIAAIEKSGTGVKVKFYDKLKALELLGRQIGMFEGKAAVPKSENNLLQAIVEATKGEVDISDLPELQ